MTENLSPQKQALFNLLLRERNGGACSPPIIPAPRSGTPQSFALSYAQLRLWIQDQFEPGSASYNLPGAFRLKGRLNLQTLQDSFNEARRRHESLRTTFTTLRGRPMQVVHAPSKQQLPLVDLTGLSEADRDAEMRRLSTAESESPFDLKTGPLMRSRLLCLSPTDHCLLVTMHHITADGWSMGVLMREVTLLYETFAEGRPSLLKELPIQYSDFAEWQRQWLRDERLKSLLDYWKRRLAGRVEQFALTADGAAAQARTGRGAQWNFMLSNELAAALESLSRREGVTLFMLLLAAFEILLFRYAGQEQITVGTPVAGRTRPEIEGLIGFFVNMLVLQGDLAGDPTFRSLLSRVREATIGAYEHQDLPFEMLVEELGAARIPGRTPLFQVVFALQNVPHAELRMPGLLIEFQTVDFGMTMYDLILGLSREEQGMEGLITYSTSRFDRHTVAGLADHFQMILETVAANPETRLSEIRPPKNGDADAFKQSSLLERRYALEDFNF